MIKRIFDIFASLTGLILLSPAMLVLCFLIAVKLGRPVFFTQIRPGKDGKPFTMVKFRSMTNETDEHGKLLPNEDRITRLGSILRSFSLDELPELVNILNGDMSLVGPRPLLMEYMPYFSKEQKRRHRVRPGITGWAQVNGRNSISWEQKLELDIWYVDNRSFWLDLKILFLTFLKVFKREGISHEGCVGMPRFDEYMKKQTKVE